MPRLVELVRRYERQRRFWKHVEVRGRDECWLWRGGDAAAAGADGDAYRLARGPLPAAARLEHRCGNSACVNPEHMDVVDPGQELTAEPSSRQEPSTRQ